VHEILCVYSRTDFICTMWCSSIADVEVPLRGVVCLLLAILNGIHLLAKSFI
jgi:hypothetical protein